MSSKRMVELIEFCEPEERVKTKSAPSLKDFGFSDNEIYDAAAHGFLETTGWGAEGAYYRVGPNGRRYLRDYYENAAWWKGFRGWLLVAVFAGIGAITGIIAAITGIIAVLK